MRLPAFAIMHWYRPNRGLLGDVNILSQLATAYGQTEDDSGMRSLDDNFTHDQQRKPNPKSSRLFSMLL